jgi:hypothetical protein
MESSSNCLHIWGCLLMCGFISTPKEIILKDNQQNFIGCTVSSKEFSFYCPSFDHRIVESRNAKFLEDVELSGSAYPQRIELEEARKLTEAPSYEACLIVFRKIKLIILNYNRFQNSQLIRNKFIMDLLKLCQM